ncbi:MAG: AraC family transcriptional regulator [Planctomycetota bacterium]
MGDSDFRYLPVRPRDVQWGINVCGAGHAVIKLGGAYPPPGHPELYAFTWKKGRSLPEYQVLYVAAGEGIFESAVTGPERVVAGTVLFLFPGVWHRYRPDKSLGWEEYWVSFGGEQMDRLVLNRFFSPEQPVLRTGLKDSILAPFTSLLQRLRETPPGFPHLIAANVMEILAATLAATSAETHQLILQGPRDVFALKDRLVSEALRLIWSGSHLQLSVAGLARRLHVTPRSLERRFQQALGRTAREEILRCRLDRVRRLLADTDLTVSEIVSASGFSSSDALARAVQRAEGTTPLQLRRHLRAQRAQDQRDPAT